MAPPKQRYELMLSLTAVIGTESKLVGAPANVEIFLIPVVPNGFGLGELDACLDEVIKRLTQLRVQVGEQMMDTALVSGGSLIKPPS